MEWKEKLQRIIDLTENHLQREESPVDRNEIAKIAECSYGFFQKVFSYMNGIGFAEYIRERKLTLAGYELKSTDKKVIDISYQYGYDSPTSFTKAFWQFHGVTPKEARDPGVVLRVTPKMQILGDAGYSWRLVQKEGVRLVGINRREAENPLAQEMSLSCGVWGCGEDRSASFVRTSGEYGRLAYFRKN